MKLMKKMKNKVDNTVFWDINPSGTEEMDAVDPVSLELCNPAQPGR